MFDFPTIVITQPPTTLDQHQHAAGFAEAGSFEVRWTATREGDHDRWKVNTKPYPYTNRDQVLAHEILVESHPKQFERLVRQALRFGSPPEYETLKLQPSSTR